MRVILVQHSFWVVVLHTQKDLYTNLSDQIWGFILWLVSYCFYWCTLTLCLYAVHKPVIDMSFSYNKSVKSEFSGILWRSLWWWYMQNVNLSFDRIGLNCISGISMSIIITKMTSQNLFIVCLSSEYQLLLYQFQIIKMLRYHVIFVHNS